jgi:hypothetical protein
MYKLTYVALCSTLLLGCAAERAYNAGQGARLNACTTIADAIARAQCYDLATAPYNRYQQSQQDKPKN